MATLEICLSYCFPRHHAVYNVKYIFKCTSAGEVKVSYQFIVFTM